MPQFLLGRNDPAAVSVEIGILTFAMDRFNIGEGSPMKPLIAGGIWYVWQNFIVKQFTNFESANA